MSKNESATKNWSYYNSRIVNRDKYHWNRWKDRIKLNSGAILFLIKKKLTLTNSSSVHTEYGEIKRKWILIYPLDSTGWTRVEK